MWQQHATMWQNLEMLDALTCMYLCLDLSKAVFCNPRDIIGSTLNTKVKKKSCRRRSSFSNFWFWVVPRDLITTYIVFLRAKEI